MAVTASNLSVAVVDAVAFVKVTGRATFAISVNFKTLFRELQHQGFHEFVLDLSECPIMDSTFLGVLARISTDLDKMEHPPDRHAITLLNANQKVSGLLENLGVLNSFSVANGSNPVNCHYELKSGAENGTPDKDELSRTCLEAHRTLMNLNPANVPKFKDVTKFLEEDLKKSKPNDA